MSTPAKPWEGRNFNMNQNPGGVEPIFGGSLASQSVVEPSPSIISSSRPVVALGPGSSPPPLPQRSPHRSQHHSAYSQGYPRYMNSYSQLGMGGGYPYSPYGGGYNRRMMGGYGMGYNAGYGGYQEDFDASMMQAIDESCQTLFGPFDALVRSISSIAMVLDSTHQAMQFSFRTVLSAADSLSKLKNLIIELASSFSIIRMIRALYFKILRFMGLIKGSTLKEKEWSEMFSKAAAAGGSVASGEATSQSNQPSPWLAFGFFSLMMGGPYLMFKLFAQNLGTTSNPQAKNGLKVGPDTIDAVAMYDFDATCNQELTLKRGERVKVARGPTHQGWVLATNGVATGFVPANRLTASSNISSNKKIIKQPTSLPDNSKTSTTTNPPPVSE